MSKAIVPGGRYFDKECGEYILIEHIGDVISFVFESDGERNIWDASDWQTLAEDLVPANDIAVTAERGMGVAIKRLNDDAIIPEYKSPGAAGFDLHITEDVTIPANKVIPVYKGKPDDEEAKHDFFNYDFILSNDNHAVVGTGLAFEVPVGYELEIRSRSGLAFKHQIMAYNGTIDSDYRSEVKLLITNFGSEPISFKKGDRVAQGIIKKVEQVNFFEAEELSETERGSGGFGSTGLS